MAYSKLQTQAEGMLGGTDIYDGPTKLSTCALFQSHMQVARKLRGVSHCVREDRKRVASMWPKSLLFLLSAVSQKKKFVFVLNYKCKVEIKIVYYFKSVTKYVSIYPLI